MDNERLTRIRWAEKESHIKVYTEKTLFEPGSWLAKPVKTLMNILPLMDSEKVRILDLGCGVGRNSIPTAQYLAEKLGSGNVRIDCVDILETAIGRLSEYAEKYRVSETIRGYVFSLEEFEIVPDTYDLIVGISALEHVKDEEALIDLLHRIERGTRRGGRICLIINSGVTEKDKESGCELEPQFEVNLPTEKLKSLLEKIFADWTWEKYGVTHQSYDIPRERTVELQTDVVTLAAKKNLFFRLG